MPDATRLLSEPLRTERMADGRRRLLRDFVVEVGGERISIPMGTESDFSIPRCGRVFVRWSSVDIASIVHNWLYRTGATTRARADHTWRLLATAGKHRASGIQAWLAWAGLRICGWYVWSRYRGRDPAGRIS